MYYREKTKQAACINRERTSEETFHIRVPILNQIDLILMYLR